VCAVGIATMFVLWIFGKKLFIKHRGKTYAVRWFRVTQA
jgi:hypothetical protein